MKKSVITYVVLLMCFGPASSAWATLVDANDEWYMALLPGESFTCIAYFIPAVPNVPSSLIFAQPPQWTDLVPFDYEAAGWDTALTDANKTVYLFGPEITNSGPNPLYIFSYKLYFRWDDEDVVGYPVYLDTVVFDYGAIVSEIARQGTPGSYPLSIPDTTWQELYGGPPYENPAQQVPEPMTVCILGLGTAFVIKRR